MNHNVGALSPEVKSPTWAWNLVLKYLNFITILYVLPLLIYPGISWAVIVQFFKQWEPGFSSRDVKDVKIEVTDLLMRSSNESQDLRHVTYKPYWLVVALSNQSLGNDILTSHDLIIWILATFGENPPLVVHIFHKNDDFFLITMIWKVLFAYNCRVC